MVDNIRENSIYTTIPPSYPPKGGGGSEAWSGACYLQTHPDKIISFLIFNGIPILMECNRT